MRFYTRVPTFLELGCTLFITSELNTTVSDNSRSNIEPLYTPPISDYDHTHDALLHQDHFLAQGLRFSQKASNEKSKGRKHTHTRTRTQTEIIKIPAVHSDWSFLSKLFFSFMNLSNEVDEALPSFRHSLFRPVGEMKLSDGL